jgi:hypothetical protein
VETGRECPVSALELYADRARHVVLKRNWTAFKHLGEVPEEVALVYMVRHPFDVLTSTHPSHPERKYYVSERRWRGEYGALKSLRETQPSRTIHFVAYEELVSHPDRVQIRLSNCLGLVSARRFTELGIEISTRSVGRFERCKRANRYLQWQPSDFKLEMESFCHEHGFELPMGFLRRSSRLEDAGRRLVVRVLARNWREKFPPPDLQ